MNYLVFLVGLFFKVYMILIAVRAILPWMPHNKFNPVIAYIYEVTDPVLQPIRKGLPPNKFGLDASPFVAIFMLWVIEQILTSVLAVV